MSGAVASSGTAMTGTTTDATPSPSMAVAVPRSSSPSSTSICAASHAASTTVDGVERSCSNS